RQKQRQSLQPNQIGGVARGLKIGVEHGIGVIEESACTEIHQQKCKVVEHIDSGEAIVEFKRIKQNRLAFDLDDIAKMQVSVTRADEAASRSCLQPGHESGERATASLTKLRLDIGWNDLVPARKSGQDGLHKSGE